MEFSMGDVKDSTVTVGHCNGSFCRASYGLGTAINPYEFTLEELTEMNDWADDPRDPGYTETPWWYKCSIPLQNYYWDRRCKLTESDVKIELGNAKEVKAVDVHQTVGLKIFVKDEKGGWVNFHHRIKLPRNAKLEEMKYTVSGGVLTVIVPKEVKHAPMHTVNDAVDPFMEPTHGVQDMEIDEDSMSKHPSLQ